MHEVVRLHVNGVERRLDVDPDRTLLEVLRDDLDQTGTKYGCGEGQCGACTVHVDGHDQRSCQLPIGTLDGRAVTTIEGLATDGRLHALQQAFVDCGAMQCGYCTPGMIMAASALLARNTEPDARAVQRALHGNICRCGTYPRIVQAVLQAARAPAGAARDGGGR